MGPITRALLVRFLAVVAVVEVVGVVLTIVADGAWRAVGLSLVLPGGGFLYTAAPVLFVLTWVAITVALVLWWGMSVHWGIPLVWALSAVLSGVLADGPRVFVDGGTTWAWAIPVVFVLAVALVAAIVRSFEARFRRKRALVPELNRYLATAAVPAPSRSLREPDEMDAELLRWSYELTMQPVDEFRGFEWGEQFHGGTVVRYELNYLGWALAPYAVNYVPNAPAQIELALRNLVLKQTDLRVWQYWRTLNLIGNLDANPDPLVRDNIMFSGFTGDQINLYEAATGSTRFDEPGSLTFVWKRRPHLRLRPPLVDGGGAAQLRAEPLGVLPVRAGLGVRRVQHHRRAGAVRPRSAARHPHVERHRGTLAPDARGRVPACPTASTPTSDRPTPGCRGTPARRQAASTSPPARTTSPTSPPTSPAGDVRSACAGCPRRWPQWRRRWSMAN